MSSAFAILTTYLLPALEIGIRNGPAFINGMKMAIDALRSGGGMSEQEKIEFQARWDAMVTRARAANIQSDALFGPIPA